MFPEEYHDQIRVNLAMNLRAIISQRLIPSITGELVVALEIMLNKGLVKELITKGDIAKIRTVLEQNNQLGMCSFDQSFFKLYAEGKITEETALANSDQPGDLKIKIQQFNLGGGQDKSVLNQIDTSLLSVSD